MFLTRFLMAAKSVRTPRYFTEHNLTRIPGSLFKGKYRLSIVVSNKMKKEALKQVLLEEENLKCISRPYVTKEEDPARIELEPDPPLPWIKRAREEKARLSGRDGSMIPHTHATFTHHVRHGRNWE